MVQPTQTPSALLSNGSRVLTPIEAEALRRIISKPSSRVLFDLLLYTGIRFVEVRQLAESPGIYDSYRELIRIRSGKVKATQKERNVYLCHRGIAAVEKYLDQPTVPTSSSAWQQNLIRWARAARLIPVPGGDPNAYNPCRLTVRTTRKTIESWLLTTFPEVALKIISSQGHTEMTALKHYLNLSFTPEERVAIADQVKGWPR